MWNCNNWTMGLPHGIKNFWMGFSPFGSILSFLFLILLIYLLVGIVRYFTTRANYSSDRSDSLGILKNRLAKGEITNEEYRRMNETLMN